MAVPPFPQRKEAQLLSWSDSFSALINSGAASYGLLPAQATAYAALHAAFATAYATATNPATNSKTNVEIKNNAKEALLNGPGGAWQLVDIAQAYPGMNDDKRSELNIRIPDSDPQPVPIPEEKPNIDLVSMNPLAITVRLHGDGVTGKPLGGGVKGATVLTHFGPTMPEAISDWTFLRNTTKNEITIDIPVTVPADTKVWITAFWFNNRMQSGPATMPPLSVFVPAMTAAAA